MPPRLLLAQPLEVLEHRPVSFHHPFCVRSEVSTDPTLGSRDHLLPFLPASEIRRFVHRDSALNIGKACGDLGAIRFGIASSFGVVTVDPAMQREATVLPLLLRKKTCQVGDHLHIGVVLAHFAQLIVYATEGDLPGLRLCQEKWNEGLELPIELSQPSNRRGDLIHGNGLSCAKPSGYVDELVVAGFKEDAIKPAFVDESLDQRDLEGLGMTISVCGALSQHDHLAMAYIMSNGRQSIPVRRVRRNGGVRRIRKGKTEKKHEHGFDRDFHLDSMHCKESTEVSVRWV